MTKIIMHGCNGKMGQVITGLCKEDSEVEIVAGIDVSDHIGKDCIAEQRTCKDTKDGRD